MNEWRMKMLLSVLLRLILLQSRVISGSGVVSLREALRHSPVPETNCLKLVHPDTTDWLLSLNDGKFAHLLPTLELLESVLDKADSSYPPNFLKKFLKAHGMKEIVSASVIAQSNGTAVKRTNGEQDYEVIQMADTDKMVKFVKTRASHDFKPHFMINSCGGVAHSVLLLHSRKKSFVLAVNISLDLNQCTAPNHTDVEHRCSSNTQCELTPGGGMRIGFYQCCCIQNPKVCINGSHIETNSSFSKDECQDLTPNNILRKVLLSVNAICALVSFGLIFLVMTQRKLQVGREFGVKGWALMEILLFGAVLLYCVLILEYLTPKPWSCCFMVWFRELGFVTFYGAVVLKIYRVRKAHHVYVKEKDLLKYLGVAAVMTATALLAWSMATTWRFVAEGLSARRFPYRLCRLEWWCIVWHTYELVLLSYGFWLCYKARTTIWAERWQFTVAVILEILVTITTNCSRYYLWYRSSADTTLLLSFIQTHLTVTVNMLLIVVPKFYYVSVDHGRTLSVIGSGSGRAHPSLAKLRDNIVDGSVDFSEIPVTEMNPEDIRAELKRVYTQLRMYKMKHVYDNNPHIKTRKKGVKQFSEKQHSSKRRPSNPTPSHSANSKHRGISRVDEEVSSTLRSEEDEWCTAPLVGDFTVQSSPHNVLLARGAVAATKRYHLQPDNSVRL